MGPDATPRDAARAPHPFEQADDDRYAARAMLGEGGMGRVELVHDRRLARDVAKKTPHHAADGARLAQEAWITAQLEHPGIVPIYDAGRTPDGALYYTMRVIRGRSLEVALDQAPDLAARLHYVRHYLAACEAVAYAHRLGIVHRDLKPQNILVGELGETQVADWGVARPVDSEAGRAWVEALLPTGEAVATMAGDIVGTPAYMSPEQSVGVVDTRADVWSLGAILYRLLAGRPPFGDGTASEVLTAVRGGEFSPLPDGVPRELGAIVQRALSRAPEHRYPSARELALDVADWLEGRRVSAYSYSSYELLKRLVRAWRVPLLVAAAALVVLIVGTAFAIDRIVEARDRADQTLAQSLLAQAQRELTRGQVPEAELLAAEALALAPSAEARGVLMAAHTGARPEVVATAELPACSIRAVSPAGSQVVCGRDTLELWEVAPRRPPLLRWSLPLATRIVQFASESVLVVADRTNFVHRLATLDAQPLHPPVDLALVSGLSASGDGVIAYRGWAVGRIDGAGVARVESVCPRFRAVRQLLALPELRFIVACDDGTLFSSQGHGGPWQAIEARFDEHALGAHAALALDQSRYATINERGRLTVAGWPDGVLVVDRLTGLRGPQALAFSPDGRWLAVASRHGATEIIDAASGKTRWRLPRDVGLGASWQGTRLVTLGGISGPGRVVTWELPSQPVAGSIGEGEAGIAGLAVDAENIVVGRGNGVVDVFGLDGVKIRRLMVGDQTVKSVALTPERIYLGAVGSPPIRVFERGSWRELAGMGEQSYRRVGLLAGGVVVGLSWSVAPQWFEATADGKHRSMLGGEDSPPTPELEQELVAFDLDVAPDGSYAAMLEEESGAVWLGTARAPRAALPIARIPSAQAVAAGLDSVVVVTAERLVWLDRQGHVQAEFPLVEPALDVALTRDGRFAVVGEAHAARVYDRRGMVLAILRAHEERVAQVVTTETAIYTASWDGAVRRWGLSALERDADALVGAARTTWGLDLTSALGARGE